MSIFHIFPRLFNQLDTERVVKLSQCLLINYVGCERLTCCNWQYILNQVKDNVQKHVKWVKMQQSSSLRSMSFQDPGATFSKLL